MKCSKFSSTEKLDDFLKLGHNVVQCRKLAGPSVSVENLLTKFQKDSLPSTCKITRCYSARDRRHESLKRNSKSEDNLLQNDENYSGGSGIQSAEKTEDILAKALNVALKGEKKEFIEKTELEEDEELIGDRHFSNSPDNMMPPLQSTGPGVVTDAQGLIVPKKLANPCLESSDRKNLHRELMFNQKIGKSVLNQKSELQRALEKQKERQLMQQNSNNDAGMKNELNRVIMERAQRIEKKNVNQDDIDNQLNPEYLNARARLRTRID